jgi:hypothetical protein
MIKLVENEKANEFVRASALDGLVTLMAFGTVSRGDVMTYFRHLFQILKRRPSEVWNGLGNACADLCAREVVEDLRQAYDEGLIHPGSIRWHEIEEALAMGSDAAWEEARYRYQLITNTADSIEWWGCFHRDAREEDWAEVALEPEDDPATLGDDADSLFPLLGPGAGIAEPFRRTEPKVGRNEPCPCGSGKKYKRCCGL